MTFVRRFAILLAALFAATAAAASDFDVRDRLCYAVGDNARSADFLVAQPYACGGTPSDYEDRWLWLKIDDPTALAALPLRWFLLVDQSRFERVRFVVRRADGTTVDLTLDGNDMSRNWALGGHLRFNVPDGAKPVAVVLGFKNLDSISTVRKFRLVSREGLEASGRSWLLLMGFFGGAMGASLIYAVALYAGLGNRLRLAYSVWALSSLIYGFAWTNVAYYVMPWLAGPLGVKFNLVVVGFAAGLGVLFFNIFVEREALTDRFRTVARIVAVALIVFGFLNAFGGLFNATVVDTIFNLLLIGGVVTVATGCARAIVRGSRSARFYLLAWALPLLILALRILANFGLARGGETLDQATFAAMALQAVLLSIGIGDRFRSLQAERDAAARALGEAEAESEAMRILADTDTLTGLYNRRGFVARAPELIGRHGMLALIDLDHFKAINDSYGHDVGDVVLMRVAETLKRIAGDQGIAGRLGGEEFGIIGPLACGEAARVAVAALDMTDVLGPGRTLTVSVGVATGATAYERFYVAADRALYRAKEEGRNRVIVTGTEDRPVRLVRSNAVPVIGPQAG
jgi:diguanylate cyclase (GGDEF)-like protein